MFFNPRLNLKNGLGSSTIIQDGTKETHVGASEYDFDNDVRIGGDGTNYSLYLNNTKINPGTGSSNALITAEPLIVPSNGTIFTADGVSAFECIPQANLNFKNGVLSIDGSTITTNNFGHMSVRPIGANMDITGNININNGNSLLLKNGIDTNYMQIYQANNMNGSFVIQNNVGSTTEFTGASAYNFDNVINIQGVPVDIAAINTKLNSITTLLYNLTGIQIS